MVKKRDNGYYIRNIFGILLLIISLFAFYSAFYYDSPTIIFWFCYLSIPLVAIGMLTNNTAIIKSQLYILAIPDLIWCVDFISYLINGNSLLGITDYFFVPGAILPKLVTLQHIIMIPIIFLVLVLFTNKKEGSWKISVIQVFVIFILTRIFTSPDLNINCVYNLCARYSIDFGNMYFILWFASSLLMIYISREIFMKAHNFFRRHLNIKIRK